MLLTLAASAAAGASADPPAPKPGTTSPAPETTRPKTSPSGTAKPAPAPVPEPVARFSEEYSVGWILVPVVVRSKAGYVENLTLEDFRVSVDGRPVKIEDFERRGEAPESVVFLQDLSGSMALDDKLEASRQAVGYFLGKARPEDEFAVASFASGRTAVDVPFTDNVGAVREAIAAWEAYGTTSLHDAVAWLPEISLAGRSVKRAAVVVTDGVDNASQITPEVAREIVRRAELPVYVLGMASGDPYALSAERRKVYRYADVLNLLASLTGGRYYSVSGPDDLKEACAAISDELRYQYVLSFSTRDAGAVKFRTLKVEIPGRQGLRILTRQGYKGLAPR